MCTLTYRLVNDGYQLFFNRDEQVTRPQAIKPRVDNTLKSAYPIDPTGGGTWIAVHENGTSFALLNYYQAQVDSSLQSFTSRGVIIPYLLAHIEAFHERIIDMDLSVFQAFQLCVFDKDLSSQLGKTLLAKQYIWDGRALHFSVLSVNESLPITSSSVDYEMVSAYRKKLFKQNIISGSANTIDYIRYHQHQGESGKCSVKMFRKDAKTVSFTHIKINKMKKKGNKINLEYIDYLLPEKQRGSSLKF